MKSNENYRTYVHIHSGTELSSNGNVNTSPETLILLFVDSLNTKDFCNKKKKGLFRKHLTHLIHLMFIMFHIVTAYLFYGISTTLLKSNMHVSLVVVDQSICLYSYIKL